MKIIVLEGRDGVGKSTQCELLKEELEKKGYSVYVQSFPSRTSVIGRAIRNIIESDEYEDFNKKKLQTLFVQEQVEFFSSLDIVKDYYDYVICDRSYLSTAIYATAQGIDEHFVEGMVDTCKVAIPKYDYVFVLGKNYPDKNKEATDSMEANSDLMNKSKELYSDDMYIHSHINSKKTCILEGIKKNKNTNDMLKVILEEN